MYLISPILQDMLVNVSCWYCTPFYTPSNVRYYHYDPQRKRALKSALKILHVSGEDFPEGGFF